jgi:putative transposase
MTTFCCPPRADSLAQVMQSLGRRYVQSINTTAHRTGTRWAGRSRVCIVEADPSLWSCSRYSARHPVRARLGPQPAASSWSSDHGQARGPPDLVVTERSRRLGGTPQERRQAYQALSQGQLSAGLAQEEPDHTSARPCCRH